MIQTIIPHNPEKPYLGLVVNNIKPPKISQIEELSDRILESEQHTRENVEKTGSTSNVLNPIEQYQYKPAKSLTEEELWEAYKTTGQHEFRNQLLVSYYQFAKSTAAKVFMKIKGKIEYDDLVSYSIFGLLDAIDKFEPKRKIKFTTYARQRIRGAILDEMRRLDWVSRWVRTKAKKLEELSIEYWSKYNRKPTTEEAAKHLRVPTKRLHGLYLSKSKLISLDEALQDEKNSRMYFISDKTPGPEEHISTKMMNQLLMQKVSELSEKEQKVLDFYYFHGLTQPKIGKIFGLTTSRISQIHIKAISKLKTKLSTVW